MVFDADTGPLEWTHGTLFALRMGARFLRINPRGMQHSQHMPLALEESYFHVARCTPSSTALCQESASNMLYFSTGVVDLPDDWHSLRQNDFVRHFQNGSSCSSEYTGRVVKVNDEQYEVSLCDLLDSNMDIVWDSTEQLIYWRVDKTWTVDYIAVAVLAVYLISVVSQNMVHSMTHDPVTPGFKWLPRPYIENIMMWVVLVYSWLSLTPTRSVLITHIDAAVFVHLSILSVVYLVMNAISLISRYQCREAEFHKAELHEAEFHEAVFRNKHRVSLFTMGLLLLLLRVYQTTDMPYLLALVFLFGSRFVYKLIHILVAFSSWTLLEYALVVCEALVFASLLGAVSAAYVFATQATAMQVLILVACWMTGIFMYLYGVVYASSAAEQTVAKT